MKNKELRVFSLNTWLLPFWFSADNSNRLNNLIDYLGKEDYDIVCLQEVWLSKYVNKLKKRLKNYHIYSSTEKLRNRRGLVILSKEKGKYEEGIFQNIGNSFVERIAKKGYQKLKLKDFLLINFHAEAFNKNIAKKQYKEIEKFVENRMIVCGDFNLEKKELIKLNKEFKIPKNDVPTIIKVNPYPDKRFNKFVKEKKLDYILTKGLLVEEITINNPIFSDHLGIKAIIKK